jgi:hypothetical protein
MHTPPFLAIFVHPSAEQSYLYFFFRTAFFEACSSPSVKDSRFLLEGCVFCADFRDDLLRVAAELARVEVARRRVEEASVDEFFFFLASSFAAATAAAASAFLS